ncbi:MAG: heme exporter protein CcmB [candidate division Zixibacteria bacterium]|nr:heme exporter protein CcmB [candidate division Zixibacteria bacterium]
MPKNSISLMTKAFAVLKKDMQCEFRTRYALNAIMLFGITTLTVVSFSVGQKNLPAEVHAALFWIIIFFSAMSGLAQVFIREEEAKTSTVLRLTASPTAVYIGKLTFNLFLLFFLELIISPLFILMTDVEVRNILLLATVLALGAIGLAGATTLIAAIISKSGAKGALFSVLSFPILLPLLMGAIKATTVAFSDTGGGFSDVSSELQLLISYGVIMITASLLLFEYVWEE